MKLRVKGHEELAGLFREMGRQAPYACALGLNEAANAAQATIQASLNRRFTLRRPEFVRRTVKRITGQDFATKDKLQAAVRIDPDRNFLAPHETGGQKTPRSGQHVAIPVNAKRGPSGVISAANRPRGLMGKPGVFRVLLPNGKGVIAEEKGKGKRQRITVLYALTKAVRLKPRLEFLKTGERAALAAWPDAAMSGIERAMATALTRG